MAVVRDPVSADFRTDSTAKKVPETAALKPGGGKWGGGRRGRSRETDWIFSFAGYLVLPGIKFCQVFSFSGYLVLPGIYLVSAKRIRGWD